MDNVFSEFLIDRGLYETIDITAENIQDLCDLVGGKIKINIYCPECKAMRVFAMKPITYADEVDGEYCVFSLQNHLEQNQKLQKISTTPRPGQKLQPQEWYWSDWQCAQATRLMDFQFVCAMDENHSQDYIVMTEGNMMRKIGQYPSVADLSFPELDKYDKVMSKEDRKEFGRALGLYANGIGIGSYVYLRRILERILDKAYSQSNHKISENSFKIARVGEKISMLKAELPDVLSSNTAIYGILSKGIHELSENDCQKYFPVLKSSILMILEQWEEIRNKKALEKELSKSLSEIADEIK